MRKFIITFLILASVGMLVLRLLLNSGGSGESSQNAPASPFPEVVEQTPVPDESAATVVVAGASGGTVTVRNFFRDEDVAAWTEDIYELGEERVLTEPYYQVFYFSNDGSFGLALQGEPLFVARQRAEQVLLSKTGLSEAEACSLQVRVTTMLSVSEEFSGQELGLSFCPGAVKLD